MTAILLISIVASALVLAGVISTRDHLMRLTLSFTASLVCHALLYFWSLLIHVRFFILVCVTAAVSVAVAGVIYRNFKPALSGKLRWNRFHLFFLLLLLFSLFNFSAMCTPWGEWDNWAIWSSHGKFLCFPEQWRNMFSPHYYWSHPDYPLLIPSLIAMFWKCTGSITYVVPVVIAVIPMAGILILLYAATADKYVATFSVILLASGNQFISQACNQYADLWLAFFALFPLVLLEKTRSEPPGNTHIHYFTGFIAATMIWIKNEGMVIFLLTILYLLWNFRKNPAQMSKLLAGTLPLIATYVVFKIYLAPPGDLFRGSLPDTLRKIVNPERFFIIAVYLSKVIVFQFPLLLLILLFFITSGAKTPSIIIIPVLTFTAYFAIYLITPYDVEWHLRTSLDRLIMQIYPTMIFLFSMTLSKYINSSGAMKIADQVTKPI